MRFSRGRGGFRSARARGENARIYRERWELNDAFVEKFTETPILR